MQDFDLLAERIARVALLLQPAPSPVQPSEAASSLDFVNMVLGETLPGWPRFVSKDSRTDGGWQLEMPDLQKTSRLTAFAVRLSEVMGFQAMFACHSRCGGPPWHMRDIQTTLLQSGLPSNQAWA